MSHLQSGTGTKRDATVRLLREHLSKFENDKALEVLGTLSSRLASDPEILFLRALALERLNRRRDAIEAAKESVRRVARHEPMLIIARCERLRGDTDEALRWCNKAAGVVGESDTVSYLRIGILEEGGRFDEAWAIAEPLVARYEREGKELPMGLRLEWSKLLVQKKRYDDAIELIDETIEAPGLVPQIINQELHLRAKACDRKKDFRGAWDAAERANEIGRIDFDPEIYREQVDALTEIWSADRMASFPLSSCESEMPVFVAGMPRSGTSLIDQIIDAHPKAAGVGELASIENFARQLSGVYDPEKEPPGCFGRFNEQRWTRVARDYVREITKKAPPGVERVVNKALGNNKLVGLIARLFPKTRVIHAIRDPRDVAISCFMGGFNNKLHPWTTRVEWAASAWEQSRRMMDHWEKTLDIPILEVRYERLVADPEHEFPRLIEFLGLEWDERCFEFHKSRRTVRTLSYDQVNRPLYTSSSGRHANYAEMIEGIGFPDYGA